MSVGFDDGGREFHTTTAYTPHTHALPEILNGLSSLLDRQSERDAFVIAWSRNPEAYDLLFNRDGETVDFRVVEYPTTDRQEEECETVFAWQGNVREFCQAFHATFEQLYEDRDTDEFEFNWRQPFPYKEFEEFKRKLA